MDIYFNAASGKRILNRSSFKLCQQQTRGETCWSLSKAVGSGTLRRICLRPGFDLYIADYRVKEPLLTCFESNRPAVGFGFWLSGTIQSCSLAKPLKHAPQKGDSPIFYFSDQTGQVLDQKNTCRRSVSLLLDPGLLKDFFKKRLNKIPWHIQQLIDPSAGEFSLNGRMSSMMFQSLEPVFNCPLAGPARMIFLEAKAMELLALRLDQLSCREPASCGSSLGPDDIKKIDAAAQRLYLDLENPPSLSRLASSVGLSHAKLNRGFHQVFGTTAFGYLRKIRLARAKILLEQDRFNVTETAFAVGYNSLSSFARAFSAQHGCNPFECRKKQYGHKI